MENANEPAYPVIRPSSEGGSVSTGGLSKREKLAMEIYVKTITLTDDGIVNAGSLTAKAENALRAADIFFEQLNK